MKKSNKKQHNWLRFLLFGGFFLYLFGKEKKNENFKLKDLEHNFLEFAHKEEKEISELVHHKEDLEEYIEDSSSIFRDYFIPHKGNDHHPKILRKKPLIAIIVLAFMFKASLVLYLFFIYPNDASMNEDLQMGVFNLLNEERIENGLLPLELNQSLIDSATDKALDMLDKDYFAHESPDGRMPWDFVSRRDYPYIYIGENLGMSFSSSKSVNDALMASPTHKKNILNKKYTDVGVVVKRGVIDGKATNVLVQLFGAVKRIELMPNPALAIASVPDSKELVEVLVEEANVKTPILVEEAKPAIIETPVEQVQKEEITMPKEIVDETPKKELEKITAISKEDIDILKEKIESEQKEKNIVSSTSPLMLGDKARSFIEKKTSEPNLELDLSDNIEFVASVDLSDKYSTAARVADYFNVLLLGILVLLSVALFLNIFIRFEVQHKPVLAQTVLFLILLFGIYSTNIHFLEKIPSYISIF